MFHTSEQFPNPRLLVLGGSGRTGSLVIAEALRRGHPVTALVRNLSSVPAREGLLLVEGSPLEKTDVEKALMAVRDQKPSVIISALGQTRKSGNPWAAVTSPPRLMADFMGNAIQVTKDHGLKKIVGISMFGAGDSFANLNFLIHWIMKFSNMAQTLEDQNLMDEGLKKSGVGFVLARPCMLKGDAAAHIKFHGERGEGSGFMPSISPKSVAAFVLDAAESDTWDMTTPVISY